MMQLLLVAHALSNIAGSLNASYTYDANGNVLSDGVRNYVYRRD
ncbi:MAG: hypothetical protein ABL911_12575 [Gallionella sp.]